MAVKYKLNHPFYIVYVNQNYQINIQNYNLNYDTGNYNDIILEDNAFIIGVCIKNDFKINNANFNETVLTPKEAYFIAHQQILGYKDFITDGDFRKKGSMVPFLLQ